MFTKNKISDKLLAILPLALLLLLWQASFSYQWTPSWLLPSPAQTATTFYELLKSGTILDLISASAVNAIPPFIFALVAALFFGTLIGLNSLSRKILYPTLTAIYPIPSLAWLTLVVLIIGFNRPAIWTVIFISCFFKMIYSVIGGVRGVKQSWILAARNHGLSNTQIIFQVILPGALPEITSGMRMGFGSAWRSLIGAEMLISTFGGLGTFIWMSQWHFNFDKVIIGIALIALIGFLAEEYIFKNIEKVTSNQWGLNKNEL